MKLTPYIRVSTDKQAEEGFSIEAQTHKMNLFIELHDLDVTDTIIDNGESACDLDRPGIQEVLRMLRAGETDGILVVKLDRLTRSLRDFQDLIEEFFTEKGGKSLMAVSDTINTETASGRMALNILMSVFQWEREAIGERTKEVLQHKKAAGLAYTRRVYGWVNVSGLQVAVEHEQAVIAYIVNMRDRGGSYHSIAKRLTASGVETPSGSEAPWRTGSVQAIYQRAKESN